jgi:hypothetical protein
MEKQVGLSYLCLQHAAGNPRSRIHRHVTVSPTCNWCSPECTSIPGNGATYKQERTQHTTNEHNTEYALCNHTFYKPRGDERCRSSTLVAAKRKTTTNKRTRTRAHCHSKSIRQRKTHMHTKMQNDRPTTQDTFFPLPTSCQARVGY